MTPPNLHALHDDFASAASPSSNNVVGGGGGGAAAAAASPSNEDDPHNHHHHPPPSRESTGGATAGDGTSQEGVEEEEEETDNLSCYDLFPGDAVVDDDHPPPPSSVQLLPPLQQESQQQQQPPSANAFYHDEDDDDDSGNEAAAYGNYYGGSTSSSGGYRPGTMTAAGHHRNPAGGAVPTIDLPTSSSPPHRQEYNTNQQQQQQGENTQGGDEQQEEQPQEPSLLTLPESATSPAGNRKASAAATSALVGRDETATTVEMGSKRNSFSSEMALVSLDNPQQSSSSSSSTTAVVAAAAADPPPPSNCTALTLHKSAIHEGDDEEELEEELSTRKRTASGGCPSSSSSPTSNVRPRSPASMAMIPAASKRPCGRTGLGNLGNTCFMNSSLQCLAHTDPLRHYFATDWYADHLNRDNPLGTGGELATEFAKLMREMWGRPDDGVIAACGGGGSGKVMNGGTGGTGATNGYAGGRNGGGVGSGYRSGMYHGTGGSSSSYDNNNTHTTTYGSSSLSSVVYPRSFKYTLGRHAEQFMGYDQHDSQELATYLLDALHEDTNLVQKKPYIEKPEQEVGESDKEASRKAWELHLQREDSTVLGIFMGQSKSKVTCPTDGCGRTSTTFDPFMYLSVPIPGATDRTVRVHWVSLDPQRENTKLEITLPKTAGMSALRAKLCEAVQSAFGEETPKVSKEDVYLADVWNNEVYSTHTDTEDVSKIRDTDETYAYELMSLAEIRRGFDEDVASSSSSAPSSSSAGGAGGGGKGGISGGGKKKIVHNLLLPSDKNDKDDDDDNEEFDDVFLPALDVLDEVQLSRTDGDERSITGGWTKRLERDYMQRPTALAHVVHPRNVAVTYEDRKEFGRKLDTFYRKCLQSDDARPPPQRKPRRQAAGGGGGGGASEALFDDDGDDFQEPEDTFLDLGRTTNATATRMNVEEEEEKKEGGNDKGEDAGGHESDTVMRSPEGDTGSNGGLPTAPPSSPTPESSSAATASREQSPVSTNGLTLDEVCATSHLFMGVSTRKDLAIFNYCRKKYHEFVELAQQQKLEGNRDGCTLQVWFKRDNNSSTSLQGAKMAGQAAAAAAVARRTQSSTSSGTGTRFGGTSYHSPLHQGGGTRLGGSSGGNGGNSVFTTPLVLRVPAQTTVDGLRRILKYRLSRALRGCTDDVRGAADLGDGETTTGLSGGSDTNAMDISMSGSPTGEEEVGESSSSTSPSAAEGAAVAAASSCSSGLLGEDAFGGFCSAVGCSSAPDEEATTVAAESPLSSGIEEKKGEEMERGSRLEKSSRPKKGGFESDDMHTSQRMKEGDQEQADPHSFLSPSSVFPLDRIPLTYQRVGKSRVNYSSYSRHTPNTNQRQLGSLDISGPPSNSAKRMDGPMLPSQRGHVAASPAAGTTANNVFARETDEGESDLVIDVVGKDGIIQMHWPYTFLGEEGLFDTNAWETVVEPPPPPASSVVGMEEEEDATAPGEGKTTAKSKKKGTGITVLDCVERYCQMEQLEETEMWYCNQCKDHVRAWKQMHIYRSPPVLILHLKRFQYSATTHRRDKIDIHVDFPLTGLDLREYVLHWENGEEPIYDCYAVSNHYGGLGGGHYTAYAKNHGQWCHFDDSMVSDVSDEREVVSRAAYVLYYRRRDVKDIPPGAPVPMQVMEHNTSSDPSSSAGATMSTGPTIVEDVDIGGVVRTGGGNCSNSSTGQTTEPSSSSASSSSYAEGGSPCPSPSYNNLGNSSGTNIGPAPPPPIAFLNKVEEMDVESQASAGGVGGGSSTGSHGTPCPSPAPSDGAAASAEDMASADHRLDDDSSDGGEGEVSAHFDYSPGSGMGMAV